MTAKKINGLCFVWLCLCIVWPLVSARAQQGAQFTQYMFNPIVINPAYAGADEALKLTLVNRSQWVSVEGAPATQGLYANSLFQRKRIGIGLSFVNDKIGIHKNQDLRGMVAYHLPVSKEATFSFGMQSGISMSRSNYASLNSASSSLDPQVTGAGISQTSLAIGIGIYYRSKRIHLGLSAPSLLPQTTAVNDTLSVKWDRVNYLLYGKYDFALGEIMRLEPSILLKYYPGSPLSFDLNACLVIRNALTLGLSYRKKESIDFLLRAQLTRQLQFGYSYDHVTGQVVNASRGSHEISVSYLFKFSHDNVESPR
ncbi:MAG TPA: type IX secretion system membrane protein PorP/SprF [Chryseolinea sp.]|nr:type IX secretion system membrane protein PorP/SprF [Chryseolinea sp.]